MKTYQTKWQHFVAEISEEAILDVSVFMADKESYLLPYHKFETNEKYISKIIKGADLQILLVVGADKYEYDLTNIDVADLLVLTDYLNEQS